MMMLRLSWRNIWRHPLRSSALFVSIVLGIGAGVLAMALMNGMIQQRFRSSIERRLSHIQIHHPKFQSEREVNMLIPNSDSLLNDILMRSDVKSTTSRTIIQGMIATAGYTGGASIIGVYPQLETATTQFDSYIIEGEYLSDAGRNPIVIGKKLADKLNVRLRSRVVLTFQNTENELVASAFRVHGIYKSNNAQLDELQVFTRISDIRTLIGEPNATHEIAILLNSGESFREVAAELSETHPNVEVQTWHDLSPELRYMLEQGSVSLYIFMIIILLGIGFGILNTMLMVVFERTRELGMLMAIGMNRIRVFSMIILETVLLCISGGSVGLLLSMSLVNHLGNTGIDLSSMADALAEFGYDAFIYPELPTQDYLVVVLMIFLTAIISSVYPSWKAVRLLPADAVRA